MPAYVITYLEVTDPKAFETYRKVAGPTFAPYGGKPLVVDERGAGFLHPRDECLGPLFPILVRRRLGHRCPPREVA